MSAFSEDFSKKNWTLSKGIIGLIGGILVFIVIPIVLLYALDQVIATINESAGTVNSVNIDGLVDELKIILRLYIIFGIPLIILKALRGFYPPGNYARLTFCLIYGIYSIVWTFLILEGGKITTDMTEMVNSALSLNSATLNNVTMTMDITGLLGILILLMAIRLVIPVAEFKGARKEYLEGDTSNEPKKKKVKKESAQNNTDVDETGTFRRHKPLK